MSATPITCQAYLIEVVDFLLNRLREIKQNNKPIKYKDQQNYASLESKWKLTRENEQPSGKAMESKSETLQNFKKRRLYNFSKGNSSFSGLEEDMIEGVCSHIPMRGFFYHKIGLVNKFLQHIVLKALKRSKTTVDYNLDDISSEKNIPFLCNSNELVDSITNLRIISDVPALIKEKNGANKKDVKKM